MPLPAEPYFMEDSPAAKCKNCRKALDVVSRIVPDKRNPRSRVKGTKYILKCALDSAQPILEGCRWSKQSGSACESRRQMNCEVAAIMINHNGHTILTLCTMDSSVSIINDDATLIHFMFKMKKSALNLQNLGCASSDHVN
jgi:hypothetical protein